jgi:hypothetical protein
MEPDVRLLTLGTRVRRCEPLLVTHTQQLLVSKSRDFAREIPAAHKKIGKNKSQTPYVYSAPHSNFIMFGKIDK